MSTESDYKAIYQNHDKPFRSGMGIEIARGWHLYENSTGRRKAGPFPTEEDANNARGSLVRQVETIIASNRAREAAKTAETAKLAVAQDNQYREVAHPIFGRGRQYASRPGATQYDSGNGRFGVQIWDNDGEDD